MRGVLSAVASVAVGTLFFIPLFSSAAGATRTCADGSTSHPATAAEAASASSGGIIAGVTQLCPEDAKLGINAAVGQAKQYLKSLPRSGTASTDSNIDQLNDAYAVCAARFLQQYKSTGDSVAIIAAYRSPQFDAQMCRNNPSCGALMNKPASEQTGNHQRGLAMDIQAGNQNGINQYAKSHPALGVCFPFSLGGVTGTGKPDTVHLIPMGGPGSEASGAGCAGVQNTCGVGSNVPIQQGAPGSSNPLSSSLSPLQSGLQGLQSLFSPPQPQQCPAGYMLMNGSCLPQQAAAQTQTTSPYSYAPPPSPPTNITGPTASGTTDTSFNTNTNVSNIIDSNGSSATGTSDSAFDLINAIANPTTTSANTAAATGTPVALGSSLGNTVALQGTTNGALSGTVPPGSVSSLTPEASQTFVSQDLSQTPTQFALQPVNSTFALLENVKQVLLSILSLLRPFGGIVPAGAIH